MLAVFIITMVLFLFLPVGIFLTWYYHRQDKEQISKKKLFYLGVILSILTFPFAISAINGHISSYDYMVIVADILNKPEVSYLTILLLVYLCLNTIIFRKDFIKRMDYWFKKIILYKPKATDYPEPINNVPLLLMLILSIAIVHMAGIGNYMQGFLYNVGWFIKDPVFDFFTIPLAFNFIAYFWFQTMLKLVRFLDKKEDKN